MTDVGVLRRITRPSLPTWPKDPFRFAALLTFTTAFLFDALVTWWGQGDLYWAGYYLVTREGNAAAEAVFRSGPLLGFAFGFFGLLLGWALSSWLPKWAVAGFAGWYVVRHVMAGAGWLSGNKGVGIAIAICFVLAIALLAGWAGLAYIRGERTSKRLVVAGSALSLAVLCALVGVCWALYDLSTVRSPASAARLYIGAARYDIARELYERELAENLNRPHVGFATHLNLASLEACVGRKNEARAHLERAGEALEKIEAPSSLMGAYLAERSADVALNLGDVAWARAELIRSIEILDAELALSLVDREESIRSKREKCARRLRLLDPGREPLLRTVAASRHTGDAR